MEMSEEAKAAEILVAKEEDKQSSNVRNDN